MRSPSLPAPGQPPSKPPPEPLPRAYRTPKRQGSRRSSQGSEEPMVWEVSSHYKENRSSKNPRMVKANWINIQRKRKRPGPEFTSGDQCECLKSGNLQPLCITIMSRLGLTAQGDLVQEDPEEPMDQSVTEEDLEDMMNTAYASDDMDVTIDNFSTESHHNNIDESHTKKRFTRKKQKAASTDSGNLIRRLKPETPQRLDKIKLRFGRQRAKAAQAKGYQELFPNAKLRRSARTDNPCTGRPPPIIPPHGQPQLNPPWTSQHNPIREQLSSPRTNYYPQISREAIEVKIRRLNLESI